MTCSASCNTSHVMFCLFEEGLGKFFVLESDTRTHVTGHSPSALFCYLQNVPCHHVRKETVCVLSQLIVGEDWLFCFCLLCYLPSTRRSVLFLWASLLQFPFVMTEFCSFLLLLQILACLGFSATLVFFSATGEAVFVLHLPTLSWQIPSTFLGSLGAAPCCCLFLWFDGCFSQMTSVLFFSGIKWHCCFLILHLWTWHSCCFMETMVWDTPEFFLWLLQVWRIHADATVQSFLILCFCQEWETQLKFLCLSSLLANHSNAWLPPATVPFANLFLLIFFTFLVSFLCCCFSSRLCLKQWLCSCSSEPCVPSVHHCWGLCVF